MVKRSEDGLFPWNVLMTEKRCQLRQELVGRNVERIEQVSNEIELTYYILLRNKFSFLFI